MHHGSQPDPKIKDLMAAAFLEVEELGATGLFPGGALSEFDEGEIKFRATYAGGKVLVDFGKPVHWLGMSSDEAKQFARVLLDLANPITRRV